MEIMLKNLVYVFIIIIALYFILQKNIEGNTCQNNGPSNRIYITDDSVKCTSDGPNPPIYNLKTVYCDENGAYVNN